MSVYNGFGTRKLEYQYSKALFGLLLVLQTKLCQDLYHQPRQGEKNYMEGRTFLSRFKKLYGRLVMLEDHKYLPPKFSKAVSDLAIVSGVQEWVEYMKEKRDEAALNNQAVNKSREQDSFDESKSDQSKGWFRNHMMSGSVSNSRTSLIRSHSYYNDNDQSVLPKQQQINSSQMEYQEVNQNINKNIKNSRSNRQSTILNNRDNNLLTPIKEKFTPQKYSIVPKKIQVLQNPISSIINQYGQQSQKNRFASKKKSIREAMSSVSEFKAQYELVSVKKKLQNVLNTSISKSRSNSKREFVSIQDKFSQNILQTQQYTPKIIFQNQNDYLNQNLQLKKYSMANIRQIQQKKNLGTLEKLTLNKEQMNQTSNNFKKSTIENENNHSQLPVLDTSGGGRISRNARHSQTQSSQKRNVMQFTKMQADKLIRQSIKTTVMPDHQQFINAINSSQNHVKNILHMKNVSSRERKETRQLNNYSQERTETYEASSAVQDWIKAQEEDQNYGIDEAYNDQYEDDFCDHKNKVVVGSGLLEINNQIQINKFKNTEQKMFDNREKFGATFGKNQDKLVF